MTFGIGGIPAEETDEQASPLGDLAGDHYAHGMTTSTHAHGGNPTGKKVVETHTQFKVLDVGKESKRIKEYYHYSS